MTNKTLSEQICEVCGIEEHKILVVGWHEDDITEPIFKTVKQTSDERYIRVVKEHCLPDFDRNSNKLKLIDLLTENNHIITMSKYYYAVGNGDIDFIDDCYNEHFEVEGSNLLEALYNYLTRWIKRSTSFKKEDGTMSEYIDTSHTLEREDCYYPRGFDDYLKDIEKIKQAIREADWEYYSD